MGAGRRRDRNEGKGVGCGAGVAGGSGGDVGGARRNVGRCGAGETKDTKAIDMILADAMRLGVPERLSRNDSVKPPTRD